MVATAPPGARFGAVSARALAAADRFLPPELAELDASPDGSRRARTAILIAWQGVVYTVVSAALYAYFGSPWSAVAIGSITVGLVAVPSAVRRGASLAFLGNAVTGITWVVTFAVGARTGGFESPAVVWSFFHPITTYVACGRRSSAVWSVLSAVQIAVFYGADRIGFPVAHDLPPAALSLMRASGFIGCILANALVIAGIEGVRVASQEAMDRANRTLDRQRILGDMHDGVGSQLMGLMIQVRAGRIDDERLLHGLGSAVDDLKLIVDSLDPAERSLDLALAELRARLEPRFEAAGIELLWEQGPIEPPVAADPERTLQVLRAVQEMTSNALRHSHATTVAVSMRRLPGPTSRVGPDHVGSDRRDSSPSIVEVAVADDGVGFDGGDPPHVGRGLVSLQARAARLDGELTIASVRPGASGTRVSLRFAG